jgi:hypothetical protein
MEQILDGNGTGYVLGIDSEHRAKVISTSVPLDKHVNITVGKTWSLYFTTTPIGNDYFFYYENTGNEPLAMTDFRTMCASPETITIESVLGTPSYTADVDIVASQRNVGNSNLPTSVMKSDTSITGLTSGGIIFFQRLDTANKMDRIRTTSNIIIPKGGQVAFKATTGTALITMVVSLTALD